MLEKQERQQTLNAFDQHTDLNNVNNYPQLLKVNADVDTKKRVFLHWCSFIVLSFIFYLCILAIPPPFQQAGYEVCSKSRKINPNLIDCQLKSLTDFWEYPKDAIIIESLENYNVFLWLEMQFSYYSPNSKSASTNITYNISIYDIDPIQEDVVKETIDSTNVHSHIITCSQGRIENYLDCYIQLLYEPFIRHPNQMITIEFVDNTNKTQLLSIQDIQLYGTTINREFTSSLLGIRYTFFAFSLITFGLYYNKLRKIDSKDWVIEQALVLLLGGLLPFFNDPLYAATILVPNKGTAIIGVIFFSDFLAVLILYFLVQFHRIVYENGEKQSRAIDWKKIVLVLMIWIFLIVSYSLAESRFFTDPSDTYEDQTDTTFLAFKILLFIVVCINLIYLLYLMLQFCKLYNSRLWRYKLIGVFSIYYLIILHLFLFTGSFSLYQFDGSKILLTITILNMFVIYLEYLWAPSHLQFNDMRQQELGTMQQAIGANRQYDEIEEIEERDVEIEVNNSQL